ncbi:MAG: thioredoxin family protein [Candidatus Neomarinimicrobiota bacterium]
MKTIRLIQVILFLMLALLQAGELEIGSVIPEKDFKMKDISGIKINLNQVVKENGLLVIFSCNTCPWVLAWEDRYNTISESCRAKDIGFITVNSNAAERNGVDSFELMVSHAQEKNYNFYYAMDGESILANAFGATRTPHVFLFNNQGILVYRGAIDDNARKADEVNNAYLMDSLDALKNGRDIKKSTSKALGCSIKFAEK